MATVRYELVYREGAAVNAPVAHMYVCDSGADPITPTPNPGDLLYRKDVSTLYLYPTSGTWIQLVDVWHPFFNENISITRSVDSPNLTLINPAHLRRSRFFMQGAEASIGNNIYFSGGAWYRDDSNQAGTLLQVYNGTMYFYYWPVGGGLTLGSNFASGNLSTTGQYFELSRATPVGNWIDIPFQSGNFFAGGGTGGIFTCQWADYSYTLIGKTIIINFIITGLHGGNPYNTVHFALPPGIAASRTIAGIMNVFMSGFGFSLGEISINANDPYLYLRRYDYSNFYIAAGSSWFKGQLTIPIL